MRTFFYTLMLLISAPSHAAVVTLNMDQLTDFFGNINPTICQGFLPGESWCVTDGFRISSDAVPQLVGSTVDPEEFSNRVLELSREPGIEASLTIQPADGGRNVQITILSYDVYRRFTEDFVTADGVTIPVGQWTTVTPLAMNQIQIAGINPNFGVAALIDKVVLNVVPVPPAIWLFISALAALALKRRSAGEFN